MSSRIFAESVFGFFLFCVSSLVFNVHVVQVYALDAVRYGGQYYAGEFLLYGKPDFWSNYGLSVEHTLYSSGAENNEALIAGKIDVNCGADSKTVELFNAIPEDALIIGTLQRGNRHTTIIGADSDIDSWDDLLKTKGKKVATRFGTGAQHTLTKFYNQTISEELGRTYEWDDFDYVNLNVEDMIAALDAGTIDAFTAWEPTPAIAEAQGVGKVLRTYGDIAPAPVSIHTTKEFAYSHRDLIVKFLAAHMDKAEMIATNRTGAARLAASGAAEKGIDVPTEAFEIVFQRINFQIDFNYTIIEEIYDTASFLYSMGKIPKIPILVYDTTFIEDAKELHESPLITNVSQNPPSNNVTSEDIVRVNATIIDDLSEIKRATLNYTTGNRTWIAQNMTHLTGDVYNGTIPAFENCTNITYIIIAENYLNKTMTTEQLGFDLNYHVIPEFPPSMMLLLFTIITLITTVIHRSVKRRQVSD